MTDEKTSFGIEDFLGEDESEQVGLNEPVAIKTGTAGNFREESQKANVIKPNATRWLFNPFEVIDLRNEPTSCGMSYLENIVFNRVRSLDVSIGKDIRDTTAATPGSIHNAENYTQFARTSLMIADELSNKHGDKGVIQIPELLETEEDAASLNQLLFGDEVECVVDINSPDHPCPVLPNLLEKMWVNVQTNIQNLDPESKDVVLKVARRIRDAIALAIRNCRQRIEIAQKRLLDEKNPNRYLSHAEQRCYLALGEEIPNQMPLLTKSATAGNLSGSDIVNAVVAGVTTAIGSAPKTPKAPSDFADVDKLSAMEDNARSIDFVDKKPKKETAKATVKTGTKK